MTHHLKRSREMQEQKAIPTGQAISLRRNWVWDPPDGVPFTQGAAAFRNLPSRIILMTFSHPGKWFKTAFHGFSSNGKLAGVWGEWVGAGARVARMSTEGFSTAAKATTALG